MLSGLFLNAPILM